MVTKRRKLASILLALAVFWAALAVPAGAKITWNPKNLRFKKDGSFEIIQVADLQEAMISSTIALDFLWDIAKREKPNLFVLTGDNIADAFCKKVALGSLAGRVAVQASIHSFMDTFDAIYFRYGIPVTMVFGNHDAESGLMTRAEQFAVYEKHPSFIGVRTEADNGTTGANGPHFGTHNLLVYGADGQTPKANLWLFDSGDYAAVGTGYDGVQQPQIDWFNRVNAETGNLPSIAFQHIIVPEIYDALPPVAGGQTYSRTFYQYNAPGYGAGALVKDSAGKPVEITKTMSQTLPARAGGALREAPCPGRYNNGQYAALSAANVMALFVGHDHVNSFEVPMSGTDLVCSPITGFGSYGSLESRGARIITLKESDLTSYQTNVCTYQAFYDSNAVRKTRLELFDKQGTWITLLDWFTFRPLCWILSKIKIFR